MGFGGVAGNLGASTLGASLGFVGVGGAAAVTSAAAGGSSAAASAGTRGSQRKAKRGQVRPGATRAGASQPTSGTALFLKTGRGRDPRSPFRPGSGVTGTRSPGEVSGTVRVAKTATMPADVLKFLRDQLVKAIEATAQRAGSGGGGATTFAPSVRTAGILTGSGLTRVAPNVRISRETRAVQQGILPQIVNPFTRAGALALTRVGGTSSARRTAARVAAARQRERALELERERERRRRALAEARRIEALVFAGGSRRRRLL